MNEAPLFPAPVALEPALVDYLRRAGRMNWTAYDLVERGEVMALARPDRLTAAQVAALETVLLVEDHLPAYMAEHLRYFGRADAPAPQRSINRRMLRFSFRWAAEEARHSHVIELYLVHTGLCEEPALEAELLRNQSIPYRFAYADPLHTFVYVALQERATQRYYAALARDVGDPLLRSVLRRMAADEASHAAFFYQLLINETADLEALARIAAEVSHQFRMPLQHSLDNYRRRLVDMMRGAPSYRHDDVFAHFSRALDRAARSGSGGGALEWLAGEGP